MSSVLDGLLTVPAPVAYAVIGGLVFAEAALFLGFVLPGETAVFLGGVLASQGRISLSALIAIAVATAIAGDTAGYEIGRHLGPRVLSIRPMRRHRARLERIRAWLRDRGGWAVFVARYLTVVRAVTPALAGASLMPYRRFLLFNAGGALTWGVSIALLGFLAGNSYAVVERALGTTAATVGTAALVGIGVFVAVRRHRRLRHAPQAPVGR